MTSLNIPRAVETIVDAVTNGEGGATVSAIAGVATPTTGYAVSLPGHEKVTKRHSLGPLSLYAEARNFIDAHRNELSDPTCYVGAWVDGDRLVFDVTRIHGCLADAVHAGVAADQDAIYSLSTGTELNLRPGRVSTLTDEQATVWQILRDLRNLVESNVPDDAEPLTLFRMSVRRNVGETTYFVADLEGEHVGDFHATYAEAIAELVHHATESVNSN